MILGFFQVIPLRILYVLLFCLFFSGCSSQPENESDTGANKNPLDVCGLIQEDLLQLIYHKPLYPVSLENGCFWNIKENGMAFLDIRILDKQRPLREHFSEDLPSYVVLQEITDLGDGGLMSITEGSLGIVVIKKGNSILKSAVTFLGVEQGTEKHRSLWSIYNSVLGKL